MMRRRRSRWVVVVSLGVSLTVLVARGSHAARSRASVRSGGIGIPKSTRTLEGKVVEVRRMSRDVTVRTRQGTLQHVVVPREAAVKAPHGERALSGIRRGMTVRILDGEGSHGQVVAHRVVARAEAGAEPEGRPAAHRVGP